MYKDVPIEWDWWAVRFRVEERRRERSRETEDDLARFVVDTLGLKAGDRVLDLGCGPGDQLSALARLGIQGVGVEIAPSLVEIGNREASEHDLPYSLILGDMTSPGYHREFDAVLSFGTTWPLGSDSSNRRLLESAADAIKPGGSIFLEQYNPLPHLASNGMVRKEWSEEPDGYLLTETWLDPVAATNVSSCSLLRADGERWILRMPDGSATERVRLYTPAEIDTMLRQAGFGLINFYGDTSLPPRAFNADSPRLVVAASRL